MISGKNTMDVHICISRGNLNDITIFIAKIRDTMCKRIRLRRVGIIGNMDTGKGPDITQPSFTVSCYRIDVIFIPLGSVLGKRRKLSYIKGLRVT